MDNSLSQFYNVKYSFIQYLKPNPDAMTTASLTLQPPLQQPNSQQTLLSLYSQLERTEDPEKVQPLAANILALISQVEDQNFEPALQLLIKLFSKGYANTLVSSPVTLQKVMQYFVSLFKRYEKEETQDLKYRTLFVLSVLAEFIRQQPKFMVPFSREFLQKVFEIEVDSFSLPSERSQVLAIVGAIYSNLSKQSSLIRELKVGKGLKQAILESYGLIEESCTVKLFNQSILQLQTRGAVLFTLCELERYGIKEMLLKNLTANQAEHLTVYLQRLFPRSKADLKSKQ